jgi:hypothetical protein
MYYHNIKVKVITSNLYSVPPSFQYPSIRLWPMSTSQKRSQLARVVNIHAKIMAGRIGGGWRADVTAQERSGRGRSEKTVSNWLRISNTLLTCGVETAQSVLQHTIRWKVEVIFPVGSRDFRVRTGSETQPALLNGYRYSLPGVKVAKK